MVSQDPSQQPLTATVAWDVADARDELRMGRGAKPVGHKLGWTSEAMRAVYGFADSNHGRLFDYMDLSDGRDLRLEELIDPLVEPEIAFRPTEALTGRSGPRTILQSGEWAVALEVVDPRWRRPFTWPENTADGSSAARFVVGPWRRLVDDPSALIVTMNTPAGSSSGRGAAVMGSPVTAVSWLLRSLEQRGQGLRPGDTVLTGGITPPVSVSAGDRVEVVSDALGTCSLQVTGEDNVG